MKRIISWLLIILCVFFLFGCSSQEQTQSTSTPEPTATPTPEPTATSTPEPTATPTPELSREEVLESKAFAWSTYGRDMYISGYKKAIQKLKTYARRYFRNPRSLVLEATYYSTSWIVFEVSGENAYGGRARSYYYYYYEDESFNELDDMFVNTYITMSTEAKGDELAWIEYLMEQ